MSRASATLEAWLGDAAREPGDLDFVVVPASISADSETAREMLDGLVAALTAAPGPGLRAAETAREEIWTYERAEGRRLVLAPERGPRQDPFTAEEILDLEVDWDNFIAEHPDATGEAREWLERLAVALARSEKARSARPPGSS